MSSDLFDPGFFFAGEDFALGNLVTLDTTKKRTVKLADGATDDPFAVVSGISKLGEGAKLFTGEGKVVRILAGGTVAIGDLIQPGTAAAKGKGIVAASAGKLTIARAIEAAVVDEVFQAKIVQIKF